MDSRRVLELDMRKYQLQERMEIVILTLHFALEARDRAREFWHQ